MKNVKKSVVLLAVVLLTTSVYGTIGDVWDVKADWVDGLDQSANPNLPWTYRYGGTAYWGNYADLYVADTVQHQSIMSPLYAISTDRWTNTGLSSGAASGQDAGYSKDYRWGPTEVGSQGPNMIRWTSPVDGTIQISGYAYLWAASYFPTWWQLKKNNVTFTSGYTPSPDPGNPTPSIHLYGPDNKSLFEDGSGGLAALILQVSAGDNIDLILPDNRGEYFGGMTAVNFSITQVPEPITMLLLGFGGLALLRRKG